MCPGHCSSCPWQPGSVAEACAVNILCESAAAEQSMSEQVLARGCSQEWMPILVQTAEAASKAGGSLTSKQCH